MLLCLVLLVHTPVNQINLRMSCICLRLQGYPSGFPVLLPNRLSQQRSTAVMQYLLDGNYLDRNTRQLVAEALTYNADLHVLGYTRATFDWQADGAIKGERRPFVWALHSCAFTRWLHRPLGLFA